MKNLPLGAEWVSSILCFVPFGPWKTPRQRFIQRYQLIMASVRAALSGRWQIETKDTEGDTPWSSAPRRKVHRCHFWAEASNYYQKFNKWPSVSLLSVLIVFGIPPPPVSLLFHIIICHICSLCSWWFICTPSPAHSDSLPLSFCALFISFYPPVVPFLLSLSLFSLVFLALTFPLLPVFPFFFPSFFSPPSRRHHMCFSANISPFRGRLCSLLRIAGDSLCKCVYLTFHQCSIYVTQMAESETSLLLANS